MIFLSSQPDDTFFIWQLLTLYENLKQLGIPKEDIHCLVGFKETVNPEWNKYKDTIHATMHFIPDDRESSSYMVSIRPNIIKKFIQNNTFVLDEYVFYHDSDILFRELPLFDGMEDGRIHVSRTDYLDHSYIDSKHSSSLMQDLLGIVGIDEETIKINTNNTGGAQIYAKGLGVDYWEKVEKDCETMYKVYWQNYQLYKSEFDKYEADRLVNNPDYHVAQFDFQIWTAEMWCMLWNQWLFGFKTFANPALRFSWPNWTGNDWDSCDIFHNSGLLKIDQKADETVDEQLKRVEHNNNWFFKQDWKNKFPTKFNQRCQISFDNGINVIGCQPHYIQAIKEAADKFWLIDNGNDKTSYWSIADNNIDTLVNRFERIKNPNKQLIILNTDMNNCVYSEDSSIVIINSNISIKTARLFNGDELETIQSFATGKLINLADAY